MTPRFQQHTQQTDIEHASPLVPALVGVTLLMGLFAPAAPASSADCQAVDLFRSDGLGMAIDGITTWKDASFPLTATAQRDRLSALFPEAAPLMSSTRFKKSLASGNTCWGQSFRKNTVGNQAMVRSIIKGAARSITQVMRVPVLPSHGKRQVLQARTILPEMIITPRHRPSNIIGPIQENLTTDRSNIAGVNQAMTISPSPNESLSLFENRPTLAMDTLKTGFQLPFTEPLRMNMTTTQALHGGNCASGCP